MVVKTALKSSILLRKGTLIFILRFYMWLIYPKEGKWCKALFLRGQYPKWHCSGPTLLNSCHFSCTGGWGWSMLSGQPGGLASRAVLSALMCGGPCNETVQPGNSSPNVWVPATCQIWVGKQKEVVWIYPLLEYKNLSHDPHLLPVGIEPEPHAHIS